MRGPPRPWLVAVLAVLVLGYVRAHYHSPLLNLEVSQTDLPSLTDSLLLQKRPLVLVDRVHSISDLVRLSVFRWLHVRAARPRACMHIAGQDDAIAGARFTLLTQAHADSTGVEIRHPRTRAGVVVLLRRHQTLVLPPMWRYRCPDGATVHELHDGVSLALRLLRLS